MKVLVIGGSGQLGREIASLLDAHSWCDEVLVPKRVQLDLTNPQSVTNFLVARAPSAVVNCGAWTAVDRAEDFPSDVMAVNSLAVESLACACQRLKAQLIQVSTDYVFDGESRLTWEEGSPLSPRSVYGLSKARAEVSVARLLPSDHLIVRTAWLYGRSRDNFVNKILNRLNSGQPVDVVDDQRGCPTWAFDAAGRIVDLLRRRVEGTLPPGTYHAVNSGSATWFEFAREIARFGGVDPDWVRPISSASLRMRAPRPAHSVLGDAGALSQGLSPMRPWPEALREALPILQREWSSTST